MKTKLFKFCVPILIVLLAVPAFIQAQDRVIDNAGVLYSGEKDILSSQIASIVSLYNFDLVIVIERSIGDITPQAYADNFFDNNGYGLGPDRDGFLFLQVTGSRDYWFSTTGKGTRILSNSNAYNKLRSDTLKFLSDDSLGDRRTYHACQSILKNWELFLSLDAKGKRYSLLEQRHILVTFIAWLFAIAIGFIVVSSWKQQMNTALGKTQAAAYVVPNSLAFTVKTDNFLYSTVTKVKRQDKSSGGGGGFSGSGGRGGGGGKY